MSQIFTRREMLTAVGAGMISCSSWEADEPAKDDFIDAHAHVWSSDIKAYPYKRGIKKLNPVSFPPEELFKHARPCGVRRVVLIQLVGGYGFDNSYMLAMIRKHKGIFSGVARIDAKREPQETMLALAKQNVRGFRVAGRLLPDDEGMKTVWQCAADHGLAVCFVAKVAALDAMCKKFPQTPLVIEHLNGIGRNGEVRKEEVLALCRLAKHKRVKVKLSAFSKKGKMKPPYTDLAPALRQIHEAFGADRLMWGTDSPFQVMDGHTYQNSIDLIGRHLDFLRNEDRQWILRKTAEQTFFS